MRFPGWLSGAYWVPKVIMLFHAQKPLVTVNDEDVLRGNVPVAACVGPAASELPFTPHLTEHGVEDRWCDLLSCKACWRLLFSIIQHPEHHDEEWH
jgi:hypothetical protein